MPSVTLLSGTVTTAAAPGTSDFIGARIYSTNAAADFIEALLTLDTSLQLAGTASDRKAGVEIWMDFGGGLEQIPPQELGEAISITEALDGYSDTAQFALVGNRWSPFVTTAVRGKNRVQIRLWEGAPGVEVYINPLFDGFISSSSFQAYPPVTTVTCLDAAAAYSQRETSTNIVENSGKTRVQWLRDFAAAEGFALGIVDLGPNGERVMLKGHSQTGPVLDIARAVLSPCGVHIYNARQALQVTRFSPVAPIERDLTSMDIVERSLGVGTPSTTSTNVIRIVSVKPGPAAGALATRREIITDITEADYAPVRWVTSQNGATIVTNPDPIAPTVRQQTQKVITTNDYIGETIVQSVVDEYEHYARRAANYQLSEDGIGNDLIINLTGTTVYKYPDSSWRADPEETFRLVRRSITRRELESDIGGAMLTRQLTTAANVIRVPLNLGLSNGIPINRDGRSIGRVTEERYFYHWQYAASHQVTSGTPTRFLGTPINDAQESLQVYAEIAGFDGGSGPDEKVVTDYMTVLNAFQPSDGTLYAEQRAEYKYTGGVNILTNRVGAYIYSGDNRSVGNPDNPYYQEFQTEILRRSFVSLKRYTLSGAETLTTRTTSVYGPSSSSTGIKSPMRTRTETGPGQMPEVELIEAAYNAQQIESTVTDGVRVYLNGQLVESIHDEYCETEADQRTLAMHLLRQAAAMPVPFSMPLEPSLHKDKWITLDIPHIGITAKRLHIRTLTRDFAAYTQEVEAVHYPPEVAID